MQTVKQITDEHEQWSEVMQLAAQYGFIWFSYAGVAMLVTSEQREKKRLNKQPEM